MVKDKKKIDQKNNSYRYCVAYEIDDEPYIADGKSYRNVYYFKPDFSASDKVFEAVAPFRCNRHGGTKTRAGGLLPIRYTRDEAYKKVKEMAEKLERRKDRKAAARRGFVKQNDSDMKVTVLCRHKGENKYGYLYKKLDPEDAAKRKKNLDRGRIKAAINLLDSLGISHPHLSSKL